jgi:cytochrome b5
MDVWNEYTAEDVAQHHSETDCWLIIGADGAKKVYDVTAFLEDHPGGPELLLDLGGQDVQDEFEVAKL